MLQDIKKTSKHSFVYAIGNIGMKVIGLILIPLYTDVKYLSHDDYGALAILEATVQLLTGLLSMSLVQGLMRWYWEKEFIPRQKNLFFTSFSFLILLLIPFLSILLFFSEELSVLLFKNADYAFLIRLTILTAGFKVLNGQIFALLKLKSKSVLFSSIQMGSFALILGLILYGIIYLNKGLEAIWWASLIGEIFIIVVLSPFVIRNLAFKFEGSILKEMFKYGFPLMLTSIAGVILATTDRYMLGSKAGLEDTGMYSLGFRIANTLNVVITTSIMSALTPIQLKKIGTPNNQRFYSKIMTYTSLIFIVGLLGISLFSLEMLKLFTGSVFYWQATGIVPVISVALLFGLMRGNANISLIIEKRTKIIGLLTLVTSLLNIGFNLLLIPLWNVYGAAFATLLSQILFFGATAYLAQKMYFIPYEWKKLTTMIGLAILIVLIGLAISDVQVGLRLAIKMALLIAYPFVLYLFGFYEKIELESIRKIVENIRSPKKFLENLKQLFKADVS